MHARQRLATFVALIALVLAGSLTASYAALARGDVVGHVYVNDNSAPNNAIAAFDRHADGSLTPMSGSPFVTGGAGSTAASSQGALQRSSDGRYLLAVDAGSNQISVLRIRPDGSLRPVAGSPVSSGGILPVSIAVYGSLVVVANDGDSTGGANYTAFRLNPGGHLTPLSGATFALPAPTTVGDILFSPDGTHLIGTRVDSSLIDSFTVSSSGLFVPAAGSPFPAEGFGPFGSKFRPTNSDQLYVSNAHDATGGAGPGTVSAFTVTGDGTLSSIGPSPYPDGKIAACWVEITRDGQFLFTVDTGSNSVSAFSIAADGSLSLIGSTTLRGTLPSLAPFDAGLDPTDHVLYVVERPANAVAGLRVNADGSLTELPSSPTPLPAGAGSAAFGIVVD